MLEARQKNTCESWRVLVGTVTTDRKPSPSSAPAGVTRDEDSDEEEEEEEEVLLRMVSLIVMPPSFIPLVI